MGKPVKTEYTEVPQNTRENNDALATEMDLYGTEKESLTGDERTCSQPGSKQLLSENRGMIQNLPPRLLTQYLQGMRQLNYLFATLQSEATSFQDDLPTSALPFATGLAKCISECLPDGHGQTSSVRHVLALLKAYGAVRSLGLESCTVSLQQVHSILEDNFADSSVCRLFDMLLKDFGNSVTKTITFF